MNSLESGRETLRHIKKSVKKFLGIGGAQKMYDNILLQIKPGIDIGRLVKEVGLKRAE